MTASPLPDDFISHLHFLTTAEVAAILRASEKTILRRIKSEKIPAIREGGRWLINTADVRALLIQGMTRQTKQTVNEY